MNLLYVLNFCVRTIKIPCAGIAIVFYCMKSLRKIGHDGLILMLCVATFLAYLPEAGEYSCFFVYLRLVSTFLLSVTSNTSAALEDQSVVLQNSLLYCRTVCCIAEQSVVLLNNLLYCRTVCWIAEQFVVLQLCNAVVTIFWSLVLQLFIQVY